MRMYRLGRDGQFAHLGDHGIPTTCCTSPSLADGRMVVRGRNAVLCYDLRYDGERMKRNAAQLAALLGSGDAAMEEQSVRGLDRLGQDAVPAVLSLLDRAMLASDAQTVQRLGRTLATLSPLFRARALPVFLKAVRSDRVALACAAAEALGSWGKAGAEAGPVLREVAQLAPAAVERACRDALLSIQNARPIWC
jgi:hypothetical protein